MKLGSPAGRQLRIASEVLARAGRRVRHRPVPVAARLVMGLAAFVLSGTVVLMLPGIGSQRPLSPMEAWFTATSAVTVCGLTVITASTDLTIIGQIVLLILIQVGGVGYVFLSSLAMRVLGRRLSMLDRLALSSSLGLATPEAIQLILRRCVYGIVTIEGLGAVALYVHWRLGNVVPARRAVLYAVFHSVSAFCNAGFDLFTGLPEHPEGIPNDGVSLLLMGLLIFLGGLGIPVLSELLTWVSRRRLSLHTRVTLVVVTALVIVGWLGLFVQERADGAVLAGETPHRQLTLTLFQSISTRTAGFSSLPRFGELSSASQLLTMVLMFIGSAPASMGGGITTGTFAVLVLALVGYARGLPKARLWGRSIPEATMRRAGAVLVISLLLVSLATWSILATHDISLGDALFEVVSAFATCGLSLGITRQLNWFGRVVIIVMMFWGRLGALTIVAAIVQRSSRMQLLDYPEEAVLIG